VVEKEGRANMQLDWKTIGWGFQVWIECYTTVQSVFGFTTVFVWLTTIIICIWFWRSWVPLCRNSVQPYMI